MKSWGIAEWYGENIDEMRPDRRQEAAQISLSVKNKTIAPNEAPSCPFLSTIRPDAKCNKPGGVCSIRLYDNDIPEKDRQPAAVCPNRFLEVASGHSVFARIADKIYGPSSEALVIKEIPFLNKVDADGNISREAKAGRFDWVLIPNPPAPNSTGPLDWLAVETQAVYFSGGNMWSDIEEYLRDPSRLHAPQAQRRPDYRSSGAKRLAPQLDAKAPVIRRWGRKVAVIVDQSFFDELASLPTQISDFDNAEVVWVTMRYNSHMELAVNQIIFSLLDESIAALQATRPLKRSEFENGLKKELWKSGPRRKVHKA
ncbi:NotI family restriction endonuclease [Falsarthrobacter nasiphocae]|uniref:Restriction endonuclease type II NotI domain-containing protein n=1 Tax=Falsarthrobacter nasiphocae TaxID=189863 RepID=A0AAE3YFT5_9MICC|nr:NotI family restriction endonuclease [Falsarthrobacter nasiphocae]MDR6891364.1 hypothetical protein [Falsarthrobacter nasiphocae]